MNPLSCISAPEETIREERLHPGIFGLPIILSIALLLPTIPLLFLFNMMQNVFSQLSPNVSRFPGPILWFLLIVIDMLPALVFFLLVLAAYQNCRITLTNKRLIYRTGFLVRAAGELPLENVEGIFILEPLLGRLLGYGTVAVSTLGGLRLPLQYLSKPHVFHAVLQKAVATAKAGGRPPQKAPPTHSDDSRYMPKSS
jgi:hypothetical protein